MLNFLLDVVGIGMKQRIFLLIHPVVIPHVQNVARDRSGDPPLSIGVDHDTEIEASPDETTRVPESRRGIEGGDGGRGSRMAKSCTSLSRN